MANPSIGEVDCPHEKGCKAEVRRCVTGRQLLYYVCRHGKITPNLGPGQDWLRKNAKMAEEKIEVPAAAAPAEAQKLEPEKPAAKPAPAPVVKPATPAAKPAKKPEVKTEKTGGKDEHWL